MDHLDARILACLDKELFSSADWFAAALDMSLAIVSNRLHNSREMKKFHLHWIPHKLGKELRQVRVAKCCEPFCMLETIQQARFHHIVTGDES
jgi:hypothetical protein